MARIPLLMAMAVLGACHSTDRAARSHDCSHCHGQNGDPLPPPAVDGTTSTQSIGVGAHQAHVRGTGMARPVPCSECHIVPTIADGVEHPGPPGQPAPVVFGLVASHDSASPSWDRATGTCSDVFCHGSTLRGAEARSPPVWTRVDGSQRLCTACHGFPPPPNHPQRTDCEACHYMVVSANGVIENPLLHIDGALEADITVPP